jgi:hypothetical protein
MNFKDSYVPATKRKSIQHLFDEKNPMKPLDFLSFCSTIKENGFVVSNSNSKLSEKIDGFGFRFGIDSFSNFFVESSNSGPIFSSGAFRKYSIEKHGSSNEISEAYEQLFEYLRNDKQLRFLLQLEMGKRNSNGIKVVCECLFTSIGKKIGDKRKFISIEYDENKLGTFATISIIKVVDNSGNELDMIPELIKHNNNELKIIYPVVEDYNFDFSSEIHQIGDIEQSKEIVKNLKKDYDSVIQKTGKKNDLLKIQKKMKEKILGNFQNGTLGKSFEGLVLEMDNFVVKVVHEDFRNGKV